MVQAGDAGDIAILSKKTATIAPDRGEIDSASVAELRLVIVEMLLAIS